MVGLLSEQVHLIFFQIIHLDISTFDMFHVSSEPLTLTLKWTFLSPTPIKDTPTMGKLDRHFGSSSSVFRPNAFVQTTTKAFGRKTELLKPKWRSSLPVVIVSLPIVRSAVSTVCMLLPNLSQYCKILSLTFWWRKMCTWRSSVWYTCHNLWPIPYVSSDDEHCLWVCR